MIEVADENLKGNIFIMGPGTMMTEDYRLDRVRIHVDEKGKVLSANRGQSNNMFVEFQKSARLNPHAHEQEFFAAKKYQ